MVIMFNCELIPMILERSLLLHGKKVAVKQFKKLLAYQWHAKILVQLV